MPKFNIYTTRYIREFCLYEIEAENWEEAEDLYCNDDPNLKLVRVLNSELNDEIVNEIEEAV